MATDYDDDKDDDDDEDDDDVCTPVITRRDAQACSMHSN